MRGFKNNRLNLLFQKDDFNQIIEYLVKGCKNMKSNCINSVSLLPNDENKIRNILLKEYIAVDYIQKQNGMENYRFEPETQENYDGKGNFIGRADIKILLKTDFERNDAYFLVECKRIDGKSKLNKKYIEEGVGRFISGKYSSYYGQNFMLGFVVVKVDIVANKNRIEHIQNTHLDKQMHGKFITQCIEEDVGVFRCVYKLTSVELELGHIFFDLSPVCAW